MKDALDLRGKSGIHRLITALEERGFIRRLPNRARALEVTTLAGLDEPLARRPQIRFEPSVIDGSLGRVCDSAAAISAADAGHVRCRTAASSIPGHGRIAAGTPIEAIQNHSHTIAVPPEMLGGGEHYALEVRGDSMIEAGIFDGDTVLIKKQDTAATGEIVVALVDEEEATLKRLRRRGNSVALEAANPAYETRIFPARPRKGAGPSCGPSPQVLTPPFCRPTKKTPRRSRSRGLFRAQGHASSPVEPAPERLDPRSVPGPVTSNLSDVAQVASRTHFPCAALPSSLLMHQGRAGNPGESRVSLNTDWVAVDWGTSHVRAWGIASDGTETFATQSDKGMGKIARADCTRSARRADRRQRPRRHAGDCLRHGRARQG